MEPEAISEILRRYVQQERRRRGRVAASGSLADTRLEEILDLATTLPSVSACRLEIPGGGLEIFFSGYEVFYARRWAGRIPSELEAPRGAKALRDTLLEIIEAALSLREATFTVLTGVELPMAFRASGVFVPLQALLAAARRA